MSVKNTVSIYAAGGCAINAISELIPMIHPEIENPGYAQLRLTLLDTSHSNLPRDFDRKAFYFVDGSKDQSTDGSGKVRATNLEAIQRAMPDILHTHPPGHLSIVIHSGSGGSGSVLAPTLVSELLSQGKNVVVLMVGSSTCAKEVENTIKTLHSYQSISVKRNRPVVCYYLDNAKHTMEENNAMIRLAVMLLAAVWSGENKGLDKMDLENFLNYQRVTQYPVGLVGLNISMHRKPLEQVKGQPISTVISMIRPGEDPNPGIMVGYHSFGEFNLASDLNMEFSTPFHFATVQGAFVPELQTLEDKLAASEEHYRVNPVASINVKGAAMDDGLII